MLIKAFLALCKVIINIILNIFDVLPDFPEAARTAIDSFFNLIFENCSFISFFVPLDFCVICLTASVAIMNFDKVYKVIMYVLRKIPTLNIKE